MNSDLSVVCVVCLTIIYTHSHIGHRYIVNSLCNVITEIFKRCSNQMKCRQPANLAHCNSQHLQKLMLASRSQTTLPPASVILPVTQAVSPPFYSLSMSPSLPPMDFPTRPTSTCIPTPPCRVALPLPSGTSAESLCSSLL